MKEELRLIIAFVLSVLIIILFGKYSTSSKPPVYQQTPLEEIKKTPQLPNETLKDFSHLSEKKEKESYTYENKTFIVRFVKNGGFIELIGLKKYLREEEKYFPIIHDNLSFLLTYNDSQLLTEEWELNQQGNIINLTKSQNTGIVFSKTFLIPENSHTYQADLKIKNENENDALIEDLIINLFTLRPNASKQSNKYFTYEVIIGTENGTVKKNIIKVKEKQIFDNCKFVAFKSGYALLLFRTENPLKVFIEKKGNVFASGFIIDEINLKGKEEKTLKFNFYAGPFDYFVASKEVKEDIFGKGFFVSMGRFLFFLLNSIHKVVPNWGWAIIILTIIIKIVFFPLTRSSLRSMKQLQKLRPYLQDLQKKYKDNPQQMQREIFNLYREYKINPFGGCIPMLIQLPIFIGFFIALRNSIFLRGAPFLFWIKDLSMPDTVFKIGNFPVNILPILMTLTSYWQQKLTPTTDPSQKTLTLLMPLMFLFIFYNFPSGLLLYWITMNIAGLIEQYFIHRK